MTLYLIEYGTTYGWPEYNWHGIVGTLKTEEEAKDFVDMFAQDGAEREELFGNICGYNLRSINYDKMLEVFGKGSKYDCDYIGYEAIEVTDTAQELLTKRLRGRRYRS